MFGDDLPMPSVSCHCGARYKVGESSLGKKAKCKKCGKVFTLELVDEGIIPIADDMGFANEVSEASQRASSARADTSGGPPTRFDPSTLPPPVIEPASHPVDETNGNATTYVRSIFAAFSFPASLDNALTFGFLWVAFFVLNLMLSGGFSFGLLGLIRFVFYLAFLGWWASYRFNVVASGAAGDNDLPSLVVPDEGVSGLLMTLLQWVGSWLVVLTPATVFAVIAFMQGWIDIDKLIDALDGGVAGLLFSDSGSGTTALGGLVVLGFFFWPIIILCIALGGFESIFHVGLIVTTIVTTFPVYLFTVVMVFGAKFLGYVLAGFVATRLSAGEGASVSGWLGSSILVSFVVTGITIYSEIVAMKLIGLYYHHFKHRFAWDWG